MASLKSAIQRTIYPFKSEPRRTAMLFAVEGAVYTIMTNLANNNNNLFATRLGATDFQLGLLSMLSQLVGICALIPGAIYTDRLKNKKKMVIFVLGAIAFFYFAAGFMPFLSSVALSGYILFAALFAGGNSLYNSSWQAFFADAVPINDRNLVFSMRTKITFIIGMLIPLLTGAILSAQPENSGKILIHQIFIFCAVGFAFLQIFTLSGIHGGNVKKPSGTGIKDLINAAKNMIGNKKFRSFVAVALFFYICWHLDWTVYFIGQTKYVGLDEFWLSISNCASALAQFLTIGLWARRNEKKGVRSGMIIGAVGLMLAPLSIVIPVLFQPGVRPIMHVILRAVFDLTCANVSLNILQCLLQVIGEENRTLSIAVYTLIIAVSNAIMPVVGVGLYTALGANEFACIAFFSICTCVRVFTVLAWYLRWRSMRGEPDR